MAEPGPYTFQVMPRRWEEASNSRNPTRIRLLSDPTGPNPSIPLNLNYSGTRASIYGVIDDTTASLATPPGNPAAQRVSYTVNANAGDVIHYEVHRADDNANLSFDLIASASDSAKNVRSHSVGG